MRSAPRSRWFVVCSLLGCLLLAGGVSGCHGTSPTEKTGPKRDEDDADSLQLALKFLKPPANYAEALTLLGAHVKRLAEGNPAVQARLQLPSDERSLLKERWKLDDGELGELEAGAYTPLDAAHLEFCFQLRDAARLAQQNAPGASRRELARRAFDWVARQVRLQEERREALPPEFVLRRGQGTALERALVFLALLPQHDIDGCLVGCRDDKNELFLWAAGALIEDKGKREILLFDPRLGVPLPGPGGVLALEEIRANPKLLPATTVDGMPVYRATPEQAAKAEVFVAPPLSALSPRMRFLESVLADFDRVHLAYDPAKLLARFGPEKAGVWGAGTADAPARLLRNFLPPNEGGVDRSGRAAWFQRKAIPWLSIRQSFPDMPNLDAETPVYKWVTALYQTYDVRPREMLVRGKFDEASRRLVRIHDEYQAEREAHRDIATVRKMRAEWSEEYKKAYLVYVHARAAVQQAPKDDRAQVERANAELARAQRQVDALVEDEYLHNVAQGADEVGLMKDEEGGQKRARPKRGLLTSIVLQSTMYTLGADAAYLRALVRQERAELAQGRRDHAPGDKAKAKAAQSAWKNAQGGWDDYLAENPFTPGVAQARLFHIIRQNKDHELYLGTVLNLLEDLFQDLAMEGQARLLRARALEKAGDVAAARAALEQLPALLTLLEKVLAALDPAGFNEVRQRINQRLLPLEQEAARAGLKAEAPPMLWTLRHLSRDLIALERGAWRDTVRGLRAAAVARLQQMPAAVKR